MPNFTGKSYKLAGFEVQNNGALVEMFAKFCGPDQDPANLPAVRMVKVCSELDPIELACEYPKMSIQKIARAIFGTREINPAPVISGRALPPHPSVTVCDQITDDLGVEQMAMLLVEMRRVKDAYLESDMKDVTFIPFKPAP